MIEIETERPSSGDLIWLAERLNQRAVTPDESRQFLREVAMRIDVGEEIPTHVLRSIQAALAGYLDGRHKTLDAAFMTVRTRRGHPGADDVAELQIAVAILNARLNDPNLSHQDALEIAGEELGVGTTKAATAWRRQRREALGELRLRRAATDNGFTSDELKRARAIALTRRR